MENPGFLRENKYQLKTRGPSGGYGGMEMEGSPPTPRRGWHHLHEDVALERLARSLPAD